MLKIKFQKFFFQNFHSFFLFFILRAFNFFTYEWKIYTRAFIIQKWKLLEMKNKKTTWVFFLLKYSKFWSASHLFWRCVIWWTNIGCWEPFFNTDSTHSLSATYIHTYIFHKWCWWGLDHYWAPVTKCLAWLGGLRVKANDGIWRFACELNKNFS